MKKALSIFFALALCFTSQAQSIWGGYGVQLIQPDTNAVVSLESIRAWMAAHGNAAGHATGQTAANSNVVTLTVGGADAVYEVSGYILITTSGSESFSLTVDYTDEGNTARTVTIPLIRISTGAFISTTLSASGAVPYPSAMVHIRCKASTNIVIKTAGTFTGCTYSVDGYIELN